METSSQGCWFKERRDNTPTKDTLGMPRTDANKFGIIASEQHTLVNQKSAILGGSYLRRKWGTRPFFEKNKK
jgi:hypothetical protein